MQSSRSLSAGYVSTGSTERWNFRPDKTPSRVASWKSCNRDGTHVSVKCCDTPSCVLKVFRPFFSSETSFYTQTFQQFHRMTYRRVANRVELGWAFWFLSFLILFASRSARIPFVDVRFDVTNEMHQDFSFVRAAMDNYLQCWLNFDEAFCHSLVFKGLIKWLRYRQRIFSALHQKHLGKTY